MEELIFSIQNTLNDYREDENNSDVRITIECIKTWIDQFSPQERLPILTELDNIFKKRYCSKDSVKIFIDKTINTLTRNFGFDSAEEFLKNSNFLNLQQDNKSQSIMLSLLDQLIQEKYNISLIECGSVSKKYSIYIDDMLCTGLTLISNVQEWALREFSPDKTNEQAVADTSTILVFAYVFIHHKSYHKKVAQMRHQFSANISSKHKMYRLIDIDNSTGPESKIDLLLPVSNGQPQDILDYKDQIVADVDNYSKKYNKVSVEEFFRPAGLPTEETLFTNSANREIVENAFLRKGIEILNNSNVHNKNMRALGYSIPSLKSFGFGALCFTWRNVPNNAPLVFWYLGGGFTPLFKVKRG